MAAIESYLGLGVNDIILGTVAFRHPDLLALACKEFPGHIILGIDARQGLVAIEGWTEKTRVTTIEMAIKLEPYGISAIIYTDIHRDGMSTGPNLRATKELARVVAVPVIASGGISGLKDVAKVMTLVKYGVAGMITGRAIYEGSLDLGAAIQLAKGEERVVRG